jgi:peptidoglycan/xylan/chitin deacetylase (PgdA/CDA1 family)
MRFASSILKRLVYPALARTGRLRRRTGGPAIVTYHGVLPKGYVVRDRNADWNMVRSENLRQQLKLLTTCYHVITPAEFRAWCESEMELPTNAVLITCDDGMQSAITEMMPILKEMGLSGLFFVTEQALAKQSSMLWHEELHLMLLAAPERVTLQLPALGIDDHAVGRMEKRDLWWKLIYKFSQYDSVQRLKLMEAVGWQIRVNPQWKSEYYDHPMLQSRFFSLNLKQTRALADSGMCIGGHSLSHLMLPQAPYDLALHEILNSKRRLEEAIGKSIWAMAYPFGDVGSAGPREMRMAEQAGYSCAFVNFGGGFQAPYARFAVQRVHVTGKMTLSEFEAHVTGLHRSLKQTFQRNAFTPEMADESAARLHEYRHA